MTHSGHNSIRDRRGKLARVADHHYWRAYFWHNRSHPERGQYQTWNIKDR